MAAVHFLQFMEEKKENISSEEQQVHHSEGRRPFCCGYMIEDGWGVGGAHIMFLKVTKGRKI